jgi:hypothetical protein
VDPSTREVLVDGVPDYMKPALLEFLKPHLARNSPSTGSWFFKKEELMDYDLVARLQPSYVERLDGRTWPGFVVRLSDDELLDLADWIVHRNNGAVANKLGYLLEAAGSAWTIGGRNGRTGIVRRMSEGVQGAVEATLQEGAAGRILGEAWAAAYGRIPDPEEAYEKAIKAVEEVAAQIVSPKNTKATLGTIIRDMKAQPGWTMDLPGNQDGVIVGMAEALWTGQESRHGGNGYRRPSQSEAETAVTLAVALLQLFASGSAARRSIGS